MKHRDAVPAPRGHNAARLATPHHNIVHTPPSPRRQRHTTTPHKATSTRKPVTQRIRALYPLGPTEALCGDKATNSKNATFPAENRCKTNTFARREAVNKNDVQERTVHLKPHGGHKTIPDGDDDDECDDGGWNTASEEMLDFEVALAGVWIFHHDGGCKS